MKAWPLALYTLKVTLKSKATIAGLFFSLIYLTIVPAISSAGGGTAVSGNAAAGAAGMDFLRFALGGLDFIGMIMAVFLSLGSIHNEIESGMMGIIATKPIRRWQIIAGKWMGHALLMTIYVFAIGFILWLPLALSTGIPAWSFAPAIALVGLNLMAMIALTLALSIFMPAVPNGLVVFIIFALTSSLRVVNAISGFSSGIPGAVSADLFRMLLPVGPVAAEAAGLMGGKVGPSAQTAFFLTGAWSFVYELIYIGALILIASLAFQKLDLD